MSELKGDCGNKTAAWKNMMTIMNLSVIVVRNARKDVHKKFNG